MKTPILAVLAALSLSAAVVAPTFAQTTPAPTAPAQGHPHGGGRMKKLAEYLQLTDAQKAQIKPILESARQQGKAIKENTSLTPDQKKSQMKDLHKSTNQQIAAILTPAQREKMKDMRQEHRAGKTL